MGVALILLCSDDNFINLFYDNFINLFYIFIVEHSFVQ